MEYFESKLDFEDNNSYLFFKILFEHYEKITSLATTRLTWENIWEYEEVNSFEVIFIPPFPKK